jgi:integrase
MPRPRPPFLNRVVTRHGKVTWVVRVGSGDDRRRVRLRAEYGTPEFKAEYEAAIKADREAALAQAARNEPIKGGVATAEGTIAWLIDRYRDTPMWAAFSPATRRERESFFKSAVNHCGDVQAYRITKGSILRSLEARAATPSQARHFLITMRGLYRWAVDAGHLQVDPTLGVRSPVLPKTHGFPMWSEEQLAAYEARWPIGTRQRVWLDVLLYTGLRRGDAVRLGRQHVKAGVATIMTEKSGGAVEVSIPILPVLAATLNAGPCGDLAFIVGENGRPLTKGGFTIVFRRACRAAGVRGSAHGLRKVAATRAANAGATVAELKAIFGWSSDSMAGLYTRGADRRRLARQAMHKLLGE